MADTTQYYEYIVVGCGGVGSGAVYWLSRRAGKGVLGLEQFRLGHDNGGSQDHSRIIRLNYDTETYVNLAKGAYKAWDEVERESGLQLVHKTGVINIGRKDAHGETIECYARAMEREGINFERLSGPELSRRYPQFTVGEETVALYQRDGGLVDAALANSVHIQLARAHGATVLDECPVTRVTPTPDGLTIVHTTRGVFRCRRLVVTAGAWINHVLGSLGVHVPVTVTQEQVTYFATPHVKQFTKDSYPVWLYHGEGIDLYGMPMHVNSGSKIGIDAGGPAVTADTRTYVPDPVREQKCIKFLQDIIPKSLGPIMYTKTCLYTMTPDRDFVIDTLAHKGIPQVVVCCGAGHAFKFASVLGRILSEIAVDGKSSYDTSIFKINRSSLTDPNFKPVFQRGTVHHQQATVKSSL